MNVETGFRAVPGHMDSAFFWLLPSASETITSLTAGKGKVGLVLPEKCIGDLRDLEVRVAYALAHLESQPLPPLYSPHEKGSLFIVDRRYIGW